jgi:hypothetical protein
MSYSHADMRKYARMNGPILGRLVDQADTTIADDHTTQKLAECLNEVRRFSNADLRKRLGEFLPEFEAVARRLREIGVSP